MKQILSACISAKGNGKSRSVLLVTITAGIEAQVDIITVLSSTRWKTLAGCNEKVIKDLKTRYRLEKEC